VAEYRKPVLVGPIGKRARELIREICGSHDVHTLKGHISTQAAELNSSRNWLDVPRPSDHE
jgi:hypothetical protein